MDKKYGLVVICTVVVVLCSLGTVSARTWYVDGDDGADFTVIHDAITAASAGDIIIVRNGTYIENIAVTKRLSIRSEDGSENCFVLPAKSYDPIFKVVTDYVNITGFTIEGATLSNASGIYLKHAEHCTISFNTITNYSDGIYLESSHNNSITGNSVNRNENNGIYLCSSNRNIITNNTINSSGDYGLCLFNSSNNTIYLNDFLNNTHNAYSALSINNIWKSPEKTNYSYKGKAYKNYLGNYWDDYNDKYPDANETDGIWDTPYSIVSDKDNHPLKELSSNYWILSEIKKNYERLEDFEDNLLKLVCIRCSGDGSQVNLGPLYLGGNLTITGAFYLTMNLDRGISGNALKIYFPEECSWYLGIPIHQKMSNNDVLEFYHKEEWGCGDISICIQDADDEMWCCRLTQLNWNWEKITVHLTDFGWRHPMSVVGNGKVDLHNISNILFSSQISPDRTSSGGTFWVDELRLIFGSPRYTSSSSFGCRIASLAANSEALPKDLVPPS